MEEILHTEYTEDAPEQGFVIDNECKADWAIERIKEERQRLELFKQAARSRIEELEQKILLQKEKCDQRIAILLEALNTYLDTAPAKKTKTQCSLELPSGKLVRKLAKTDYQKDEEKLLMYLGENAPEYVKMEPKAMWGEFKKCLMIVDGQVMRADTGEVLDCVSAIEKPSSFDVL